MKTIFTLLLAITFCFADTKNLLPINNDFFEINEQPIQKTLKIMEEETSKLLPVEMDAVTVIDNVFSYENVIVYTKKLSTKHELFNGINLNTDSLFHQAMFELDSQVLCSHPTTGYLIVEKGAIFIYKYVNENSKNLFVTTIDSKDCMHLFNI